MSKKKTTDSSKSRKKTPKKSWWLWRFMWWRPVRWFILIVIIAALLYLQRSFLIVMTDAISRLFGWGLVFFDIALVTLLVVIWRRKLSSFIYRWYRWLGSIVFIVAAWGILAFPGLGGWIGLSITGQNITDYPVFLSVLRVLGLIIIGIILIAPRPCFRLLVKMVSGFISWLRGPRVPRPVRLQKRAFTPASTLDQEIEAPEPQEVKTSIPKQIKPEKTATTPVPASAQSQQELRQVAQEVWKKYGESSTLVTIDGWQLPPIDILDRTPEIELGEADNIDRAKIIEEALASYGVEAKVVQINAGPTVTQFGLEPGWERKIKEIKEKDKDGNVRIRQEEVSRTRVKVDRITSLANDLALTLAAPSIRIEAPVPGKSIVGIEVPNTVLGLVGLRGVIETTAFQKTLVKSKLTLALGKGAGGEAVAADLAKMPHLLIAGATGSGKTVCLNSTICCLLLHNTPNEARFILVDPKRVELTPFNSVPHLAAPVIVDTSKALGTLRWLNQEMDKRYQEMAKVGVRNIEGYNKTRQGTERMPYLVLVIDELADLMMAGYDEVEHILCRLAQLARATGIHLIVATQRPSVDVVTGLIKANFPTRISFAVTSQVDSRTILDMGGAEKLLGKGDMLFMPTESAKPKRLQGCYVSDAETERLVYFWGSQRREDAAQLRIDEQLTSKKAGPPDDPLLEEAMQLLQEHKHVSASFLQRRLHIGYPRAARLMEQLEEMDNQVEVEEGGVTGEMEIKKE